MPIYINTTKLGSEAYNVHGISTKLNKIKMQTTDVWQGLPPYYNELKNGTVLNESQWLEFLDGGGIAKVIQLNDQANFLNKQIQLNNSQVSTIKTWTIADFNHDNTSNTVDFVQSAVVANVKFSNNDNKYNNSYIRTWLINTYLPAFSSDIKNKLQTMSVSSNGSTLNDKIKLLSGTEVGTSLSAMLVEGEQYPIFSDDNSRIRTAVSTIGAWALRSCNKNNTTNVFDVLCNSGTLSYANYSNTYGVVPCIRFA